MDYRYLRLGGYYVWEGERVRLTGLGLRLWPAEKAWATVQVGSYDRLSVPPEDLEELPDEQ